MNSLFIFCAFGFFITQHVTCTEETESQDSLTLTNEDIQKQANSLPSKLIAKSSVPNSESNPNPLRKLIQEVDKNMEQEKNGNLMNDNTPQERKKRESRWDFSNISGDVSNIRAVSRDEDYPEANKKNNNNNNQYTCIDGNRVIKGVNFDNISGNIGNMTCYVGKEGKPAFKFSNIKGSISNIKIVSQNNDEQVRNYNPPRFIHNMRPYSQWSK